MILGRAFSVPRHLTLAELVVNLFLYGGVGWWLGGRWGIACGIAVLLALYGSAIVAAVRESSRSQACGRIGSSAAAQDASGSKDLPEIRK